MLKPLEIGGSNARPQGNNSADAPDVDRVARPFRPDPDWVEGALWQGATDDLRPYALIDGSWCVGLYGRLLNSDLSWTSLQQGQTAAEQLQNAPFLVALKKGDPVVRWLLEEGWGKGWGIYCFASTAALRETYRAPDQRKLEEMQGRGHFLAAPQTLGAPDEIDPVLLLRQHFRRFTEIEFEDSGKLVLFRFFDPAVLRTWLASCNSAELATVFGPVRAFNIEAFNELPSLNLPQEIHRYTLSADDGGNVLSVVCRDIEAGVKRPLSIPAPSQERAERTAGPHLMLRNGQIAAFRQAQLAQFQEELALELADGAGDLPPMELTDARASVNRHLPDGREFGLRSRADLTNFVVCRLHHGDEFPQTPAAAKAAFDQASDPSDRSAVLRRFAQKREIGAMR